MRPPPRRPPTSGGSTPGKDPGPGPGGTAAPGPRAPRPRAIGPARQRLVEANLPYVRAIAAHVKERLPRDIEFDDLVAYGTEGLLEAAARFDGRHGASFTTFAYYRVRGAIYDGLRRMGWLPRGEWARARFDERAGEYLADLSEREAGRRRFDDAGDGEVEDQVRELADTLGGLAAIFIAALTTKDEEQLVDPSLPAPDRLERERAGLAVQRALAVLPERERRLIELYYFEDQTLEAAGASMGLSKSWTSRLHARAIDLLQDALARAREPGGAAGEPGPGAPPVTGVDDDGDGPLAPRPPRRRASAR